MQQMLHALTLLLTCGKSSLQVDEVFDPSHIHGDDNG
jgi:hypothetical protein